MVKCVDQLHQSQVPPTSSSPALGGLLSSSKTSHSRCSSSCVISSEFILRKKEVRAAARSFCFSSWSSLGSYRQRTGGGGEEGREREGRCMQLGTVHTLCEPNNDAVLNVPPSRTLE